MFDHRETRERAAAAAAAAPAMKPQERLRSDGDQTGARRVVISLAQDFVSWQFSIEGHLPSTDDGLDWEPLP